MRLLPSHHYNTRSVRPLLKNSPTAISNLRHAADMFEKLPAVAHSYAAAANADARRVIVAKGLRAMADGFVSILLPAYLLALGYSPLQIGAIMTATLLGSALLTLFAGRITGYFGERRPLIAASILMAATGLGFAGLTDFWPLLAVAFAGTLNPSSGDVSVFLPLEQSLLARSAVDKTRTMLFALYS